MRFKVDKARRGEWYWRRPGEMPFQHGPYGARWQAWLAAWKATR